MLFSSILFFIFEQKEEKSVKTSLTERKAWILMHLEHSVNLEDNRDNKPYSILLFKQYFEC